MPFEEPAVSRISVEEGVNEIRFSIPVRREWGTVLFLGFWLCGWAAGELFALGALVSMLRGKMSGGAAFGGLFLVAWLGAWTVGGVMAFHAWLRALGGAEIVTVDAESLTVKSAIPGLSRTKEYRAADITSLGVAVTRGGKPRRRRGSGCIFFRYGACEVSFGENVDLFEAEMIVERISERFPAIVAREGS